ncbi:MAG TPA: YihY family inner membrane protein [Burkholderiales bacterium]|jgi:membrane protein
MLEAGIDAVKGVIRDEILQTRQVRYVEYLVRRSVQDQLPQAAGSLTFTTLLSLIPLVTIALALFSAFPLFASAKQAIENFLLQNALPRAASDVISTYVAEFADSAGKLTTVGLAGLAITAAALMQTIFNAFDAIWRVPRPRPLWRRVLIYWSTITLGPVLIGTGLAITSYLISQSLGLIAGAAWLNEFVLGLVPVALTFIAFTLLYFTVPNSDVQLRHAATGGLAAALGFELMKHLFAVFISRFPTYHLIYGTFAAVPIFLMWIYLSWMIALVGALIAATWPLLSYERAEMRRWPGARFTGAMQVLSLLMRLRAAGGASARQVRKALRTAFSEAEALLEELRAANWIGRLDTAGHEGRWVLICDPDKLTVADVFRRFAFDATLARGRLQEDDPALGRSMGEVGNWVDQGLNLTLAAAFREEAAGTETPQASNEGAAAAASEAAEARPASRASVSAIK